MSKEKKRETKLVKTPVFRLSFPQLKTKGDLNNKYSVVMLFGPDQKEAIKPLIKLCKEKIAEKWPNGKPKKFKNPFIPIEESEYDGEDPGGVKIRANSEYRPGIVDQKLNAIDLDEIEEQLYPGCYCRAAVNVYTWTYMGKSGVSFGLEGIQKVKDGEPLGGRTDLSDVFDEVEIEDDLFDDDDQTDDDLDL